MEKITVTLTITAGDSVAERFKQSIDAGGDHFEAARTLAYRVREATQSWLFSGGYRSGKELPDGTPVTSSVVVDLPGHRLQDSVQGTGRSTHQVQLGLVQVVTSNIIAKIDIFATEVREHLRRAAYAPWV